MADAESGGKGAGGARQTRHAARAAPPIDVEPLDGGWQRLDAWTPGLLDAWTRICQWTTRTERVPTPLPKAYVNSHCGVEEKLSLFAVKIGL